MSMYSGNLKYCQKNLAMKHIITNIQPFSQLKMSWQIVQITILLTPSLQVTFFTSQHSVILAIE